MGYAIFFAVLFFFQIGISFYSIMNELFPDTVEWLRNPFPGEGIEENKDKIFFLYNLVQPLYIIGLMPLLLLISMQIYPVEKTLNWERTPGTKILIITSISMSVIFIPILTWSYYTFITLVLALFGFIYGLLVNIGVNIKLAAMSTGEIRKRSVAIIFASILFYLGFLWTLEIQEISIARMIGGIDSAWDITLGCVVQGISALMYYQGLKIKY